MNALKVGALALLAIGAVACSNDTDGTITTPDVVAGLRYVHVVPDTGALDFRVVDVLENAPNQIGATFRTGGNPGGVTTTFLPPYQAVAAGTRRIRVFVSSNVDTIASRVVLDTAYAFNAGVNHTFYLYRTAGGAMQAFITQDVPPTLAAGQFGLRVVDLALTKAGNAGLTSTTSADVFLDTLAAGDTPTGTPTFAATVFGDVRPYVARTAGGGRNYRIAFAGAGSTTPYLSADVPNGVAGTSTANPIAGDLVAGSVLTAVIVPRSTAGTAAPQTAAFQNPAVVFLVDQKPPRTAP